MDPRPITTHTHSISSSRGREARLTRVEAVPADFCSSRPMMDLSLQDPVCAPPENSEFRGLTPLLALSMTKVDTKVDTEDRDLITTNHSQSINDASSTDDDSSVSSSSGDMPRRLIRTAPGNGPTRPSSLGVKVMVMDPTTKQGPRLTLSAFRRPENTVRIACLDSSRTIESEYDLQQRALGHGAFSTVRLAVTRRTGAPVAVKTIAKHQVLRSRRLKSNRKRHEEWEILQQLENNPNILTPVDVFETDEDIQLVLEFCDGGELFDVIQRHKEDAKILLHGRYEFPEDKASGIIAQVLSALTDLESRGIAHRDVKAENILLKTTLDGSVCVKLSDFGTARVFNRLTTETSSSDESDGEASPYTPPSRTRTYSTVGSDYYTAPEISSGEGYGTSVDVYSLGVTLYILLCGSLPSFAVDSDGEETSIVEFSGPCWKNISQDATHLLSRMLEPDPSKRISASDALKHKWITDASDVKLHMTYGRFLSPGTAASFGLMRRRHSDTDLAGMADRGHRKRLSFSSHGPSKRSRGDEEVQAGALIASAMAKLYKGVAAAAHSASEAAACVVFDELGQEMRILDDSIDVRDESDNCQDDARTSPLESSLTALSV